MNEALSTGILERIEKTPYAACPPGSILVPFYDHSIHLKLAYETVMSLGRHGGDDVLLIVDSHTATQSAAFTDLRDHARQVFVLGALPQAWSLNDNVTECLDSPIFHEHDHVFVLISSSISIAILGSLASETHDDETPIAGGWTMQRTYVAHAVEALLATKAKPFLTGMTEPEEGSSLVSAIAMRLMTLHANALAMLQQDMAMDKSDLFSVLNILKAISAKRRAHDILFIFVEQIAKVVRSDRCSVVRVWGGDRQGQVLASHEDASIMDRSIHLSKYPELEKALNIREKVVINDVKSDPLTADIANTLQDANINAILVIPIVLFDENIGSLFLRAARGRGAFSLREISFFEIVTEAASNALERAHLFESIQVANESLERLAVTDGLTGLFNHRHFRERLDQELERALRYRLPLSCMIFDVDNFKKCNDTYGHLTGDSILREIAERTRRCVRKSDVCARYGGEEFVVLMPQTALDGAMAEAERIRDLVAANAFHGMPADSHVTVSIGVAVLDFDAMLVSEDLLRAADQALYQAKRSGKNRVVGPDTQEHKP